MKIKTIDDIAYWMKYNFENKKPKPVVFIGAGASKTAGIPLANEIVDVILEKFKEEPAIMNCGDRSYSKLMDCLPATERNDLLNGYISIENTKINVCHIYLAQLIVEGYVDYVLTVNFDNLMIRALALYNCFPPVYDLSNLKDLTTQSLKKGSIVYLNGQCHGLWLYNTNNEFEKGEENVVAILNTIKNRPWLVIGYSGEDPVFEYIKRLGRFDDRLYWIGFNNELPSKKVLKELLDINSGAYLIQGYDADSFMTELSKKLGLPQPEIFENPFSFLKSLLNQIVLIEDKDIYRDIKQRQIKSQNNIDDAKERYEDKKNDDMDKSKYENDISILKKQIIDDIVQEKFKDINVDFYVSISKIINNAEINNSLSDLFIKGGNELFDDAKLKKSLYLLNKSIEKYKLAIEFDTQNDFAFNNWGCALSLLASFTQDENYYRESIDKFDEAIKLNQYYVNAYKNKGNALFDLARMKNSEEILQKSIECYNKAIVINPNDEFVYNDLGIALFDLAKMTNNKKILEQSIDKSKKAIEINPYKDLYYYNYGIPLQELAKLNNDDELLHQSIECYEKAISLNPNNDMAFNELGIALSDLAKMKKNNEILKQSIDNFKKAIDSNPNNFRAYINWGMSLFELAKFYKEDNLFNQAEEKFKKAIVFGASSYHLSCLYAYKNNKTEALSLLEKCLDKKEYSLDYVLNDSDWDNLKDDTDFISLIEKYKQQQ